MLNHLKSTDHQAQVLEIFTRLQRMVFDSRVALPPSVDLEISHHYGIDRFDQWGAILVNIINRAYSKMLVMMFPGQSYPQHRHIQKDESYHILYGDLVVEVEGEFHNLKAGDLLSVNRGTVHSFKTSHGVIIEEIATTYLPGDSVYEDDSINKNPNRKTQMTFWPQYIAEHP
jgi:quercetin dioxygenase-like cupin family protein